MSQKTIQTYETVWKRRILPPTGTFTGHRAPNRLDCPTGCAAVDFMLMGELPLEYPRNTFDYISRACTPFERTAPFVYSLDCTLEMVSNQDMLGSECTVSYTHLTLPTILLV